MKPVLTIGVVLGLAALVSSCSQNDPPLATVTDLDLGRYSGTWHEIARLPNRFEKNVVAATARYDLKKTGDLTVRNDGLKADGTRTSIEGRATPVGPGKLKVRFNRFPANLFAGNYWVLWVDPSYQKAVVGDPGRKFLWLLSKDPASQTEDFAKPVEQAKASGFETERLFENPKRL